MYHIFFIHSSVDGHSGCFHVLAIVNSTARNIGVHVSFRTMFFSACMPRSGIAGSCVCVCVCVCVCLGVRMCIKFPSHVWLSVTPWSVPRQAPYSWDCPDKNTGGAESSESALDELLSVSHLCFHVFPLLLVVSQQEISLQETKICLWLLTPLSPHPHSLNIH